MNSQLSFDKICCIVYTAFGGIKETNGLSLLVTEAAAPNDWMICDSVVAEDIAEVDELETTLLLTEVELLNKDLPWSETELVPCPLCVLDDTDLNSDKWAESSDELDWLLLVVGSGGMIDDVCSKEREIGGDTDTKLLLWLWLIKLLEVWVVVELAGDGWLNNDWDELAFFDE